jgi:hypothetical protein
MILCEHDRAYMIALYDKWIYLVRSKFYWVERFQKLQDMAKPLVEKYESDAEELLERCWELGVHCDILTEEVRFWKAWREEEYRLMGEDLDKDAEELPPEIVADWKRGRDGRADDFLERMKEKHERFTKLGIERSKREPGK